MKFEIRPAEDIVIVECNGEAHENPFIDHCYECMPYWKHIKTCPICKRKLGFMMDRIVGEVNTCRHCKVKFYTKQDYSILTYKNNQVK